MLSNKERQKSHIKNCFLDAARKIVSEEGIAAATAKRIGDQAGYSYATIYNYYANLNELLCEAVESLNRDVAADLAAEWAAQEKAKSRGQVILRIQRFARLMLDRLAGNGNIYYPFISTEIDFDYFKQRDGHPFVHPAYELLLAELDSNKDLLGLSSAKARTLADVLSYVFHAKLHFFLRYRVPDSKKSLESELEDEIELVLDMPRAKRA